MYLPQKTLTKDWPPTIPRKKLAVTKKGSESQITNLEEVLNWMHEKVAKMICPQHNFFLQVADTSIAFPNPDGSKKKLSLKALAKEHLGQEIQSGTKGHDPQEDALAALDLMKLKIS